MADSDDVQQFSRTLRAAVAARDVAAVTDLVGHPSIEIHLQEAGEAVLTLLEHDGDRVVGPARTLAAALEERAWSGDAELAELLVELAEDQPTARRRVRADLDQVAELLEDSMDMGYGGLQDCRTGDVWPQAVLDDWAGDGDAPDPDADADAEPDRYLFVPNEGSHEAWRDMRQFAAGVDEDTVREQLLDAIDGRGAFSRVPADARPPRRSEGKLAHLLGRTPGRTSTRMAGGRGLRGATSPAVAQRQVGLAPPRRGLGTGA